MPRTRSTNRQPLETTWPPRLNSLFLLELNLMLLLDYRLSFFGCSRRASVVALRHPQPILRQP
jgi:hypothetical protein